MVLSNTKEKILQLNCYCRCIKKLALSHEKLRCRRPPREFPLLFRESQSRDEFFSMNMFLHINISGHSVCHQYFTLEELCNMRPQSSGVALSTGLLIWAFYWGRASGANYLVQYPRFMYLVDNYFANVTFNMNLNSWILPLLQNLGIPWPYIWIPHSSCLACD